MILRRPSSTPTIIVLDNPAVQVFFRMTFFLIRVMEAPLSYYVFSEPLIKYITNDNEQL
jgi:hypothetical protein